MSRTVVVTGGCGYIGSHVARAFKQNGARVFIIDEVFREHTVKGIDGYWVDDFAQPASLAMLHSLAPDVIVHCAGTSLVGPSMVDPAKYYDNNISKTITLLNFVKDLDKMPVIMFSSSASVYGEATARPVHESDQINPISPYGNTKAMTETILRDYWDAYALQYVCFRYFNAAGAEPFNFDLGQAPDATHLIARTLEASIANRAININGDDFDTMDGTCVRDYIHVWDIATAHVLAANKCLADQNKWNAESFTFNLGTNTGISNKEIVDYVVDKYGLPFVNFSTRRSGDPATLIADATYARRMLDWKPVHSGIGTIIDSAYKWYTRQ